jgi:Zn-dependent protease
VLSARANQFEAADDIPSALAKWNKALPMLPPAANQTEWVRQHLKRLEVAQAVAPPKPKNAWAKKFGPLAPIAIFLAKAKWLFALFKFKFLFSLGAFFLLYWSIWGWKFGLGFAVAILVHEMGHYLEIRRRGLPADMPVFLPGFGAYVRWQALGVSLETRAMVSLAGPFAGAIAALVCLTIYWKTGDPLWAGLARAGAWLNVMNLIPLWVLDGSGATAALDRTGRSIVVAAALLCAVGFQEGTFFLIAGSAIWRLYTKDFPAVPSSRIAILYPALLVALGLVLKFVPGSLFGR